MFAKFKIAIVSLIMALIGLGCSPVAYAQSTISYRTFYRGSECIVRLTEHKFINRSRIDYSEIVGNAMVFYVSGTRVVLEFQTEEEAIHWSKYVLFKLPCLNR